MTSFVLRYVMTLMFYLVIGKTFKIKVFIIPLTLSPHASLHSVFCTQISMSECAEQLNCWSVWADKVFDDLEFFIV